jgi:pentatricopeptide repeat protein
MLAQEPPLRFVSQHVRTMTSSLRAHLATAARLRRWAEEDGVWDQLTRDERHTIMMAATESRRAPSSTFQRPALSLSELQPRLVELYRQGDWHEAERLVAAAQAGGVVMDAKAVTFWLGCYVQSGEWRRAEAAWKRVVEAGVIPDAASYRNLMRVYMSNGEAEQLAKIDSLYEEMRNGSGPAGHPLQLSVRDFRSLLRTAHRCRLADAARKWADRAKAAGMLEQLDESSRHILATIGDWEHQPRPTPLPDGPTAPQPKQSRSLRLTLPKEGRSPPDARAQRGTRKKKGAAKAPTTSESELQQRLPADTAPELASSGASSADATVFEAAMASDSSAQVAAADAPDASAADPSAASDAAAPSTAAAAASSSDAASSAADVADAAADAAAAVPAATSAAASRSSSLSLLTVVQLRAQLKDRGLKVSGVKSELIERLAAAQAQA